ncbi:MAG: hypothetical protein ACREC8_01630, partial [Limisphaerales bacterium]
VECPPHYDTFAEFQYAYHYGDVYSPYIKQEEPLKTECQHFLDCIKFGKTPLTDGRQGLELVRILEASSESLKKGGAPVQISTHPAHLNGSNGELPDSEYAIRVSVTGMQKKKITRRVSRKPRLKLRAQTR